MALLSDEVLFSTVLLTAFIFSSIRLGHILLVRKYFVVVVAAVVVVVVVVATVVLAKCGGRTKSARIPFIVSTGKLNFGLLGTYCGLLVDAAKIRDCCLL